MPQHAFLPLGVWSVWTSLTCSVSKPRQDMFYTDTFSVHHAQTEKPAVITSQKAGRPYALFGALNVSAGPLGKILRRTLSSTCPSHRVDHVYSNSKTAAPTIHPRSPSIHPTTSRSNPLIKLPQQLPPAARHTVELWLSAVGRTRDQLSNEAGWGPQRPLYSQH